MDTWIEQFSDEQVHQIHGLMIREWWCLDRTLDDVHAVIKGSTVTLAAVNKDLNVIAFARALSDGIFKAVLFDVIVKDELYCPDRISGFYTKQGFEISESKLHRCITPGSQTFG